MQITFDKAERQKQKALLKAHFPDYDAKHHDAFVMRWNSQQEKLALEAYQRKRGIYEDRSKEQRNIAILGGDPTL